MAWLLKETERSHVTDRDGSHCICRDFTVIALCFKLDLHSSRSLYSSSLKWINAKVNGRTALALQFKSSMDQRQGQWTHSSRSTVQQRQGGTQISRNGRKISIPDNNRHEQETFRSQVHTLDFDWTARQLCMSCT